MAINASSEHTKYNEIYINNYQSVKKLREDITKYMHSYNFNRFHSVLGYKKPMNVYLKGVRKVVWDTKQL